MLLQCVCLVAASLPALHIRRDGLGKLLQVMLVLASSMFLHHTTTTIVFINQLPYFRDLASALQTQ